MPQTNKKHSDAVEFVKTDLKSRLKITSKEQTEGGYDLSFNLEGREHYLIVLKTKFEKETSKSALNAINAKKWVFISEHLQSTYIAVVESSGNVAYYSPQELWNSSNTISILKYCSVKRNEFSQNDTEHKIERIIGNQTNREKEKISDSDNFKDFITFVKKIQQL